MQELNNKVKHLRSHIYTAHQQWDAHSILRDKLDDDSIITIEDYQMNMELNYAENPTSLAFSTNKVTFALYPVCVEYTVDGKLRKGAIAFISEDKLHDHQQVKKFEERMHTIIQEKLGRRFKNWGRFTDGCGSQFKSRFCNADAIEWASHFEHVGFHYYESHEGKNISDTIGSIVKCAFLRGVIHYEHEIRNDETAVKIVKENLKEITKKFEFVVIEPFPVFAREKQRQEWELKGIRSIHSIVINKEEGKIIALPVSCQKCEVSTICSDCSATGYTVSELSMGEEEEDDEIHVVENDVDDEGQTDDESDEESDDEETDESVKPGDVVWGLFGRIWYPATVADRGDVPEENRVCLGNKDGRILVKWYSDGKFSLLRQCDVQMLGSNPVDESRAVRSATIRKAYHAALADSIKE